MRHVTAALRSSKTSNESDPSKQIQGKLQTIAITSQTATATRNNLKHPKTLPDNQLLSRQSWPPHYGSTYWYPVSVAKCATILH